MLALIKTKGLFDEAETKNITMIVVIMINGVFIFLAASKYTLYKMEDDIINTFQNRIEQ